MFLQKQNWDFRSFTVDNYREKDQVFNRGIVWAVLWNTIDDQKKRNEGG